MATSGIVFRPWKGEVLFKHVQGKRLSVFIKCHGVPARQFRVRAGTRLYGRRRHVTLAMYVVCVEAHASCEMRSSTYPFPVKRLAHFKPPWGAYVSVTSTCAKKESESPENCHVVSGVLSLLFVHAWLAEFESGTNRNTASGLSYSTNKSRWRQVLTPCALALRRPNPAFPSFSRQVSARRLRYPD